jgi:hypothetical protein
MESGAWNLPKRGEKRPSMERNSPLSSARPILFLLTLDECSIAVFNQATERDAGLREIY